MGLLTPDPGLLFWMVITFGVVFFILAKYGFPVILKTVEDRKAYIDNSLKAAREANEQLANVKVEGEKLLAQAREEQHHLQVRKATCLYHTRNGDKSNSGNGGTNHGKGNDIPG